MKDGERGKENRRRGRRAESLDGSGNGERGPEPSGRDCDEEHKREWKGRMGQTGRGQIDQSEKAQEGVSCEDLGGCSHLRVTRRPSERCLG